MPKTRKTVTLEDEVIEYLGKLRKVEDRNFSNMLEAIVKRYRKIAEQLNQGLKMNVCFSR